jgi:predicted RNA-binding protein with PUA-like domain
MANYWLVKSEETCYSIDDLARDGKTMWDGVRNYQARNYMRDGMKLGDKVLYYHSNSEIIGVVGVAEVVREAYPDHTALDPLNDHYDPKATAENALWIMVDIGFVSKFPRPVSLQEIKDAPDLAGMVVAQKGSRLSVQPVSEEHFQVVCKMGGL